jgi:ssDNA-specific exonuclease RecJ
VHGVCLGSDVPRLICTANYYRPTTDEKKQFKKYFKFQVTTPFDIQSKTHRLFDSILLEIALQNLTPGIFLASLIVFF